MEEWGLNLRILMPNPGLFQLAYPAFQTLPWSACPLTIVCLSRAISEALERAFSLCAYHLLSCPCPLSQNLCKVPIGIVLGSWGCHNKVPYTGQLKSIARHCLTILMAGSHDQEGGRATILLKPVGTFSLASSELPVIGQQSLIFISLQLHNPYFCAHPHMHSACLPSHCLPFVCLSLCSDFPLL